jgi:hypothetical protein
VDPDGHGFDERPLFESESGRKGDNLLGLGREPFLGAARSLESADFERIADVRIAPEARGAAAADLLRQGRDFGPGGKPGDVLADGLDDPGELMSLDDRIRGEGMPAMVDVDIGSADADPPDADQNLARIRRGLGDISEFDDPGLGHDGLSHRPAFLPRNILNLVSYEK